MRYTGVDVPRPYQERLLEYNEQRREYLDTPTTKSQWQAAWKRLCEDPAVFAEGLRSALFSGRCTTRMNEQLLDAVQRRTEYKIWYVRALSPV